MATTNSIRNAAFRLDGESALYLGLHVGKMAGAGIVYTSHVNAMSITRTVAPNGPRDGQTVIPASVLLASIGKRSFRTAKAMYAHRDAINTEAKAAKAALKAIRAIDVL